VCAIRLQAVSAQDFADIQECLAESGECNKDIYPETAGKPCFQADCCASQTSTAYVPFSSCTCVKRCEQLFPGQYTPYMKLAYGAKSCRQDVAISSLEECKSAVVALGYPDYSTWTGHDPGIPAGCAIRESPWPVTMNWNTAKKTSGARPDLAPICLQGVQGIAGYTEMVSMQTLISILLAAAGAVACIGIFRHCGRRRDEWVRYPTKEANEHSILLDNAKVFAQFLVVYTHILYYNVLPESNMHYRDTETWLHGAQSMMISIVQASSMVKMPLICFISGICSQGVVTTQRIRRYIVNLVVPTTLWVFVVKPVMFDPMLTLNPMDFWESVKKVGQFRSFHEEWYLQALVLWRGSTFLLWSHLRPPVACVIMLMISCGAGYMSFGGRMWYFKLDETFGFWPYFAMGYIFPFSTASNAIVCKSSLVNVIVGVLVLLWCCLVPILMPQPLPDGHGPYSAGPAGAFFGETTSWDRQLWWTQRIAKLVLEMIPTAALLLLVLPRTQTPLTWIGEHTLYPFLFHLDAHAWRNKIVMALHPPVIAHKGGHVLVLALHVLYTILVLVVFASGPFRKLFSWCFRPTWIEDLIFEPNIVDPRGAHVAIGAGTGECLGDSGCALIDDDECELGGLPSLSDDDFQDSIRTSGPTLPKAQPTPVTTMFPSRRKKDKSDTEPWTGDMPTWSVGARIPHMQAAREFYWTLLPLFTFMTLMATVPPIILFYACIDKALEVLSWIPLWVFLVGNAMSCLSIPTIYIYHYFRLRDSLEVPGTRKIVDVSRKPLLHCVVVVAYKEPLDVMCRTMNSILEQQGIHGQLIILFATEARDSTRHEIAGHLKQMISKTRHRFIMTEHVLMDNETVGKSSNENWAVRELHRTLVEQEGNDPFEIMVTICDADALMSKIYLANVEQHFYDQADGRRLCYSGPLNVHRNFGDGALIVQMQEVLRCHNDLFFNPALPYLPQSNYSLTLGLCAEIDFWTPDNMPEDFHTAAKVNLITLGAGSTIPVEGIICNDLVESFADRYVQAKRHQWGLTDIAWQFAVRQHMDISFYVWLKHFSWEMTRIGGFMSVAAGFASYIIQMVVVVWVYRHWERVAATPNFYYLLLGYCFVSMCRWTTFWMAEAITWRQFFSQFEIKHASCLNWLLLVMLSPVLHPMVEVIFFILPSLHCLYHVTFVGELGYVCAPKGEQKLKPQALNQNFTDIRPTSQHGESRRVGFLRSDEEAAAA